MLNTPIEERDPYLDPELMAFPYVNGGLFADDNLALPFFTDEIVDIILEKASADFDWSDISPTIFGAIFESTLNPETRRSGGMHYTSIENIHKVIDPLFLDDLKAELAEIKAEPVDRTRNKKLRAYQDKLASLKWLDPAAGSGNFLTETYLCVRRLENEVISDLHKGQIMMAFDETPNPIKVSINQFYGIEINDFACATAQTAMWIAEAKMMKETESLVSQDFEFFPLTTNANICEGNALRMDWNDVIPSNQLNIIMGNPPFVANSGRVSAKESSVKAMMSSTQKEDKQSLFGKTGGVLDYVACWYMKSALYMKNTSIQAAFVSTNSICQGQQVTPLWRPLFDLGIKITFAHRSFKWDSEATDGATVFVVIVGISYVEGEKFIYQDGSKKKVNNINGYLTDSEAVFLEKRTAPLCNVPKMHRGSQPTDDGNLIFSAEEYNEFVNGHPECAELFRQYAMGKDFIDRTTRYCLWLVDADITIVRSSPEIMRRINMVKDYRLRSSKAATRKKADTPMLFDENQQPETNFIALPKVSSGNRRYVPIDFMKPDTVVGDKIYIIEDATEYEFGIMTSNVHMAWMRTTCGYYGPSYQYSNTIVYNNFPWPTPTEEQKVRIQQTAQGILDVRSKYPYASFADLYDELTMPVELRRAHQANDRAVMEAYGFNLKMTEQECVAELMRMYQKLVEEADA